MNKNTSFLLKGEMVKSKEKQKLIHIEKLAQLKAKQIEISKKQDRQREFYENILEDLYKIGGLWQTKVQLEDNLAKITSESKKKLALKHKLKPEKFSSNKLNMIVTFFPLVQMANHSMPDNYNQIY